MAKAVVVWISAVTLGGCAIAARSDKFGADLDIGIGGIVRYIADIRVKASVGFSKTCPDRGKEVIITEEGDEGQDAGAGDPDPLGVDHFL